MYPPANRGDIRDVSLIPGSERSPGGGHGNPLQYSCQENPMDRGAWQATLHRVTQPACTLTSAIEESTPPPRPAPKPSFFSHTLKIHSQHTQNKIQLFIYKFLHDLVLPVSMITQFMLPSLILFHPLLLVHQTHKLISISSLCIHCFLCLECSFSKPPHSSLLSFH